MQHARLQVEQDGARDVARVIRLVEEDVFAVAALGREVLEVAILVDAVLLAQLLPELLPHAVAALARLQRDDFAGHRHSWLSLRRAVAVMSYGRVVGGGKRRERASRRVTSPPHYVPSHHNHPS